MAKVTPLVIQIFCCGDVEAAWHEQLAAQCEEDYRIWQEECRIADAKNDQLTLHNREPEFYSARTGTDGYWPPPELDAFEECERDPALVYPDG